MKKILLISVFSAAIFTASAQLPTIERQVVASAGDFSLVGNISISYTIGEMAAVTSFTQNPLMHLTQGFQQPDNWYVGIKTNTLVNEEFTVFPNPASEQVTIRFNGMTDGRLRISLVNILGQHVKDLTYNPQIGQTDYLLDLTGVTQGLYVLELTGSQYGKEFKKQDRLNVIF